MNLGQFIGLRFVALFGQILGTLAFIFALIALVPYDIASVFVVNNVRTNPENIEVLADKLRSETGLDEPVYIQYFNYLDRLFIEQSLGSSWETNADVSMLFSRALMFTLFVFGISAFIYIPLAFILGIYSAKYRRSWFDYLIRVITTATYSIPPFIMGLWLIATTSRNGYRYAYFPLGSETISMELLKFTILPVITVVFVYTGFQFRLIRNHFLEILQKEYIRTARAKGLSERVVVFKHALRNALPFFLTTVAVTFPIAFSGIAVVEFVFGIPGAGTLMVNGALNFDWPILIAGALIYTVLNALILGATDVLIFLVSPQLRFEAFKGSG